MNVGDVANATAYDFFVICGKQRIFDSRKDSYSSFLEIKREKVIDLSPQPDSSICLVIEEDE